MGRKNVIKAPDDDDDDDEGRINFIAWR